MCNVTCEKKTQNGKYYETQALINLWDIEFQNNYTQFISKIDSNGI